MFNDNKEGVLGMRVARAARAAVDKAARSSPTRGQADGGAGARQHRRHRAYPSSEGKKGDAVWGTRGRWTMLAGTVGGEPVTIAMLDHPKNPGYPTYWHARGYGLFAANPLGPEGA